MVELGSIRIRMAGVTTSEGFEWKMKDSDFYNQITIGYKDQYSTKSIKVFPNGSVQIAGCADLFDCSRVIRQLSVVFKQVLDLDNIISSDSYRVVMINTNFSINHNVNLIKIADHFARFGVFNVTFEPDRYSAVKIKFKPADDMKEVTTSIFSTGKIIVTGAETLKEIAFAYNIINQHLNSEPGLKVSKTAVTDTFDIVMGYKFTDWVQTLQDKNFKPWTFTRTNPPILF
jgi:TATA-box binding protein (TBP) (component of TFIID and TFIIIB)